VRRLCAEAQPARAGRRDLESPVAARARAWIDIFGTLFFLLPMAVLILRLSWPVFVDSWRQRRGVLECERPRALAGPPAGAAGFALLVLQGIAELLRRVAFLARRAAGSARKDGWRRDGTRARGLDPEGEARPMIASFLVANMAPLMFASMVLFMLLGYPVAFSLAANGILFGLIGIQFGCSTHPWSRRCRSACGR